MVEFDVLAITKLLNMEDEDLYEVASVLVEIQVVSTSVNLVYFFICKNLGNAVAYYT